MNDFESRARAAARGVHDLVASADAPTVDTVAVPLRKRHTIRALLAAAAVVLVAAIVGGVIVTTKDDGPTAAEVTAFCDFMHQRTAHPENDFDLERATALAPDEIRSDVSDGLRDHDLGSAGRETIVRVQTSLSRVAAWYETNCFPAAAQPGAAPADQRFGPGPTSRSATPCYVLNGSATPRMADFPGHIVIYAGSSGSLLAVATTDTSLVDDGALSVDVAGIEGARVGSAADIQGRVLPQSQAIEWDGAHHSIALLTRRIAGPLPLGDLARQVTDTGDRADLPADAVPNGMTRLYDGPLDAIRPDTGATGPTATFSVTTGTAPLLPNGLGTGTGSVWSGALGDRAAVDATALFVPLAHRETLGGRDVLTWQVTGESEAASADFARWAEPGGVVLTVVTYGADADARRTQLTEAVGSMRKLDRDQWTDLTRQFSYCGALTTLGRAESSSGSASAGVESGPITETPTTTVTGVPATTP